MNLSPKKDLNSPEAIIKHVLANIPEKKTLKGIKSISFSGASNFIYMGDYQSAPVAAAAYKGYLIYIVGAAGVADTIKCCMKSDVDTYSWRTVDLIPKIVYLKVIADDTALTTGDGKMYFTVNNFLNGMNLVDADAAIYTVSSSGLPTVGIYNLTDSHEMLSTLITIDVNEYSSYVADAPPVINTTYDDVATGDIIRIDVDVAGTGTKGLDVILTFQLP